MWEQITRADMDRAKHRIAIQRRVMLKKHAEQLQALEAEGSEIEALERMVAAFATKHLASSSAGVDNSRSVAKIEAAVESSEPPEREQPPEQVAPPQIEVQYQASPDSVMPFRKVLHLYRLDCSAHHAPPSKRLIKFASSALRGRWGLRALGRRPVVAPSVVPA